jgi:hypothetical protein
MSDTLPKEIIALAREEKWKEVRGFIKNFIELTLKSDLPYDITLINGTKSGKSNDSVVEYQIEKQNDIDILDDIEDFDTLSIYQFNQHYENNLYLKRNQEAIIFFAKYMSGITDKIELECFEFIIMLDSTSNPVFLSNSGSKVNYNRILEVFEGFEQGKEVKDVEDIPGNELEAFVFEQITGRNAVWGGSETKAFKEWKEAVTDLYTSETGNYSYYSGSLTKKYRKFLERMYTYWEHLSENGQYDIDTEDLEVFLKFLK